ECSRDELKAFFGLAMYLGMSLPSSPILWPEAAGYSASQGAARNRLANRNVLVLGGAQQWRSAFPPETRLPIDGSTADSEFVRMQGRQYSTAAFDPALGFLQLVPSPWNDSRHVLIAGGWRSFAEA